MMGTPIWRTSSMTSFRNRVVNAFVNRAPQVLKKRTKKVAVKRPDEAAGVHVNPGNIASARQSLAGQEWTAAEQRSCAPGRSGVQRLAQETSSVVGKH